jgi:hypothetical protein
MSTAERIHNAGKFALEYLERYPSGLMQASRRYENHPIAYGDGVQDIFTRLEEVWYDHMRDNDKAEELSACWDNIVCELDRDNLPDVEYDRNAYVYLVNEDVFRIYMKKADRIWANAFAMLYNAPSVGREYWDYEWCSRLYDRMHSDDDRERRTPKIWAAVINDHARRFDQHVEEVNKNEEGINFAPVGMSLSPNPWRTGWRTQFTVMVTEPSDDGMKFYTLHIPIDPALWRSAMLWYDACWFAEMDGKVYVRCSDNGQDFSNAITMFGEEFQVMAQDNKQLWFTETGKDARVIMED